MTEVINKDLYLAWLKDKARKTGEETLDCVHVVVDPMKSVAQVSEFVKRKIIESPHMFFIGTVAPKDVEITVLKIAFIEKGEVEGAVLAE